MADSGWYPDPADESLERFWDGAAWTTSTRGRTVEPPVADVVPPFSQPGSAQPGYTPQSPSPGYQPLGGGYVPPGGNAYAPSGGYGYAPPGGNAYAPPGGNAYVPYGASTSSPVGATWGRRALAALIDAAIGVGPLIVGYVIFFVALAAGSGSENNALGGLGALVLLATVLWVIGFGIWNQIIRQGKTGQTIGKSKIGLRLVKDIDGQPIGAGMALARYFIPSLISNFTCGIFGLLDILWPLWDAQRKRIIDKWFNFSVIDV